MKRIAPMLLVVAACRTAPAPAANPQPPAPVPAAVSSETMVDHAGDSTDTAVEVPAGAQNGGVDFENNWIFDRFGRFRRRGGGTGVLNGRRYNVVKIELPGGDQKTVYFDITENWNASTRTQ